MIEMLHPDFLKDIDPKDHWVPMERTTKIDGREVLKELLDENGEVSSWCETVFNEEGIIVEVKEWTAGETLPDKHQIRILDSGNRLVREETWFRGELLNFSDFEYDEFGRQVKLTRKGEGEEVGVAISFYNRDSKNAHTEEYWLGDEKYNVINYLYEDIRGEWELIEERSTVLNDLDQSRIKRYFYNGLGPNNAVEKVYNRHEKLLEEIREFNGPDDKLLRREFHTSDSQFSEPFQIEIYEYHGNGKLSDTIQVVNGVEKHKVKEWYDEKDRLIRTHSQMGQVSNMYFHVYED